MPVIRQTPPYGPPVAYDSDTQTYLSSALPGVDIYGRVDTAIPGLISGCEIESDGDNSLIVQPGILAIGEPYHYIRWTREIICDANVVGENGCDKQYAPNRDGIYYAYVRAKTSAPFNNVTPYTNISIVLSKSPTIGGMIMNMGYGNGFNAFRKMPFACRMYNGLILPFNMVGAAAAPTFIPVGADTSDKYKLFDITGNYVYTSGTPNPLNMTGIIPDNARIIEADLYINGVGAATISVAGGVATIGQKFKSFTEETTFRTDITLDSGLNFKFESNGNANTRYHAYLRKYTIMETT